MNGTLTITIQLGNAAMEDGYDAYQAIAKSDIPHSRNGNDEGTFRDANGNTVGEWKISGEPDCPGHSDDVDCEDDPFNPCENCRTYA